MTSAFMAISDSVLEGTFLDRWHHPATVGPCRLAGMQNWAIWQDSSMYARGTRVLKILLVQLANMPELTQPSEDEASIVAFVERTDMDPNLRELCWFSKFLMCLVWAKDQLLRQVQYVPILEEMCPAQLKAYEEGHLFPRKRSREEGAANEEECGGVDLSSTDVDSSSTDEEEEEPPTTQVSPIELLPPPAAG